MIDYMKLAHECGAIEAGNVGRRVNVSVEGHIIFTKKELEAFATRICADKDAEIARLKDSFAEIQHSQAALIRDGQSQLQAAQDLIAMQAEALRAVDCDAQIGQRGARLSCGHTWPCGCSHSNALKALSATADNVAEWKARELEPLRMEVAMAHDALKQLQDAGNGEDDNLFYSANQNATRVRDDTQATALAYEKEVAAKALEDAAQDNFFGVMGTNYLLNLAAVLRAESEKA